MTKRLLTVTNRDDLHADLVGQRVTELGEPMFRLNLDEFPEQFSIEMGLLHGRWEGNLTHIPTGDAVRLSNVGATWIRKRADFSFPSKQLPPQERAYAEAETEHLLFSLLHSLDCYWMSHPSAMRGAGWKGEQLQRAARMGFTVPASLATNRPQAAGAFLASRDQIVFKAQSSASLAAERVEPEARISGVLPTTLITAAHRDLLEAVTELPCFFQDYVPKSYELRVTVIGDRVFAAKIHSQDDPRTAVDWRDMSAEIRYEKATLPDEIERRCRAFVQSYGLTFGALDLIVTPEGDHVFLENNPGGQFLFVQELVPELDMIGAVADCLREGARRQGEGR